MREALLIGYGNYNKRVPKTSFKMNDKLKKKLISMHIGMCHP